MTTLCDEARMAALIADMQSDPDGAVDAIERLLMDYPEDARLHFLLGSNLIGRGRLIEGYQSLSQAVALAPDYAIARFQLGLFQLTSGEVDNALATFGPLDRLPDTHYLRKFVDGLRCLIRDDFAGAMSHLADGVRHNEENPPLNSDMQMVIDQCRQALSTADATGEEATSETSLILQQFSGRIH